MTGIEKVAIIGAGTMGRGIAQRFAQEGLDVILADNEPRALKQASEEIEAMLKDAVTKGLFTGTVAKKVLSRIRFTDDLRKVSRADLVIEAIFEDRDAKFEVFGQLDKICGPKTIFASNTSSLSIDELAKATDRPDRFLGLHFFYHPAKNRLVEVVRGKATTEGTFAAIWRFCRLLGMVPIKVKDSPGFAVNRIFVPWLNEATRLVDDFVADIPTVEAVAKEAFGIELGPFGLMNATGIPIAFHSAENLEPLGHFYGPSNVLRRQFLTKRPWDMKGRPDKARSDRVKMRLLGVVFHEACSLLDEKVASLDDIERGVRIGLRWAMGPFELMNSLEAYDVDVIVKGFYDRHPNLGVPEPLKAWREERRPWTFDYVELIREGPIARVIINRPETMNAINGEVLHQLEDRFDAADRDRKVRTIVLEGVGKAFMAGADIKFFIDRIEGKKIRDIISLTKQAHGLAKKIDQSKKLVIAKLDGVAMGGGVEFALVADVIVASERARLGFPETGIGIYPALGGTQRLPRLVGKALARYLIMTGDLLEAEKAKAMGLVQYVVPSARIDDFVKELPRKKDLKRLGRPAKGSTVELEGIKGIFSGKGVKAMLSGRPACDGEMAMELARKVSTKAPIALRLADRLIDDGLRMDIDDGLELELSHLEEIFSTKDALIGLRSLGKGRPGFKGN
jgi:enoyl-CoA hydratase/3-hydroxyacyl-CoA dehydrogenase